MTHPCPGAPPGQNSRWREWGTKVSGGALISANCSVPGEKRRSLGPHFSLIPGSKQGEQKAWYQILRQGEGALPGSHAHTPAGTADIPALPGTHTDELTHPHPSTPIPELLDVMPPPSPLPSPFLGQPQARLVLKCLGSAVSPRPPKANRWEAGCRDANQSPAHPWRRILSSIRRPWCLRPGDAWPRGVPACHQAASRQLTP